MKSSESPPKRRLTSVAISVSNGFLSAYQKESSVCVFVCVLVFVCMRVCLCVCEFMRQCRNKEGMTQNSATIAGISTCLVTDGSFIFCKSSSRSRSS
jgi:hypothetical protein